MNLVTGLGNIGAKYTFTRHNAGFMVVDSLALNNSETFKENTKLKSLILSFLKIIAVLYYTIYICICQMEFFGN